MDEQDFELLLESVKQAGEIKWGQRPPSRVFAFKPQDVKVAERNPKAARTPLRQAPPASRHHR